MSASIKGVALDLATAPIRRGLDRGKISWDELEVRLQPRDLELLEEKIVSGLWYPVDSFDRLLTHGLELQGVTSHDQWAQVGFQVANGILTNHVFDNMVKSAVERREKAGFVLVGLAPLLLNFSKWQFANETDDGYEFRIDVTDALEFPNGLMLIVQGMIEYLSTRVFETRLSVHGVRPTPDHIVYRSNRVEE